MPNWINGCLKVRGTKENVLKFFKEGINVYEHVLIDEKFESVKVPKEQWLKIEEFPDSDEIYVTFNENDQHYRWAYVEGTRRAFIDFQRDICIYNYDSESETYLAEAEINQAWNFETEEWLAIAKKYNVDIFLWGLEYGTTFGQKIDIRNGVIFSYETTKYDLWAFPIPWMGG